MLGRSPAAQSTGPLGIAQIGGDDAEFVREFVEGAERMRLQPRNRRVEPTARDHQQRKPGPGLLIMDADVALFMEAASYCPPVYEVTSNSVG